MMRHTEQWIWLPNAQYPNAQTTDYNALSERKVKNYTVAEFTRKYTFASAVVRADLRFSGDTAFQLFCNDRIIATGPACVGGDFIGNDIACDRFYAFETTLYPDTDTLHFFARVQMMPLHICEFSKGHGGFMLSAILTLADGTQQHIATDESWIVRKNGAYCTPITFNGTIEPDIWSPAERTENIWNTETAPIPVREEYVLRADNNTITLQPHEAKTFLLEYDKIWGGFVQVRVKTQGIVSLDVMCRELEETGQTEKLRFTGEQEYRSFYMHSTGNMQIQAKNDADTASQVEIALIVTHYPVSEEATTVTSDPDLNLVLDTCKHTLKICRQTHHLDSTRHCEPLACTGDYYIESLMTAFSFGDMRLAEFDLQRTANMLTLRDGRMFHTTYSLIWVRMLHDVYQMSGRLDLLRSCKTALDLLLRRFAGYLGENGLIETPSDYMFIDWIYIDTISMHHPPKALGQTCLNLYYFGALEYAAAIYRALGYEKSAQNCLTERENLRKAINTLLFDAEKGCYFEGLNTPTAPELLGEWMPQNVETRYYLKQSNILAAYFGVCDDMLGRELVRKVMENEIAGDYQPYFTHYLLEAVYRLGLRETYTRTICDRWKPWVKACPKGLVEGFVAPEPTYSFDHSHAWGGTPLYSLPKALLGLEILEPGMRKIALSPSLLGLQHAKVELLTPYGKVICEMKNGKTPCITHPDEVTVELRS